VRESSSGALAVGADAPHLWNVPSTLAIDLPSCGRAAQKKSKYLQVPVERWGQHSGHPRRRRGQDELPLPARRGVK
jgi:hypothetical protein